MGVVVASSEPGQVAVAHVRGDVDITGAGALRDALEGLVAAGHRHLVVDLTEVAFIDSTGLGIIVGRLRALRRLGGSLTVAAAHERVLRVLRITGLDTVLPVHADLAGALAAATATNAAARRPGAPGGTGDPARLDG